MSCGVIWREIDVSGFWIAIALTVVVFGCGNDDTHRGNEGVTGRWVFDRGKLQSSGSASQTDLETITARWRGVALSIKPNGNWSFEGAFSYNHVAKQGTWKLVNLPNGRVLIEMSLSREEGELLSMPVFLVRVAKRHLWIPVEGSWEGADIYVPLRRTG